MRAGLISFVPFGLYLSNHIRFGNSLTTVPRVYSTNYFIKDTEGRYLNEKVDKKVWVIWAEGRVHGEYDAIKTPIGYIPLYDDLKALFKQVFDRDYTEEEYVQQFSIRGKKHLEKLARIEELYKDEEGIPEAFWEVHETIKAGLKVLRGPVPPSFF